jgi:hypothetical protein
MRITLEIPLTFMVLKAVFLDTSKINKHKINLILTYFREALEMILSLDNPSSEDLSNQK